jgi:hypothetical protein
MLRLNCRQHIGTQGDKKLTGTVIRVKNDILHRKRSNHPLPHNSSALLTRPASFYTPVTPDALIFSPTLAFINLNLPSNQLSDTRSSGFLMTATTRILPPHSGGEKWIHLVDLLKQSHPALTPEPSPGVRRYQFVPIRFVFLLRLLLTLYMRFYPRLRRKAYNTSPLWPPGTHSSCVDPIAANQLNPPGRKMS